MSNQPQGQESPRLQTAAPAQEETVKTAQNTRSASQTTKKAASAVSQITGGGTFNASSSTGAMTLGNNFRIPALGAAGGVAGGVIQALSPFKVLFSGAIGAVKGIGAAFKDKKKWIPAFILAVIWTFLILLPALGINPIPVRFLSWLTFAQGGIRGGIGGAVLGTMTGFLGGVLGKMIFAGLITSFIMALAHKQNPFKSIGGGVGRMFSASNFKEKNGISYLLTGAGIAFIGYNFMAGTASFSGTMAGIAALLLTLKSLGSDAGFLRDLVGGLFAKNKMVNTQTVNTVLAGMASGFALSLPLSVIPWAYTPYVAGVLMLIAGLVLKIGLKNNKKAVAT